jgi:hypothetical protein
MENVVIPATIITQAIVVTVPPKEYLAIVSAASHVSSQGLLTGGEEKLHLLILPIKSRISRARPLTLWRYVFRRLIAGRNCKGRRIPAAGEVLIQSRDPFQGKDTYE